MRPASAPRQVQVDHASWMTTGLLLWLCTLPLIGLLVLPWFGTRVALLAAVALLLAAVAACYGICAWKVVRPGKGDDGDDDQ